METNTGFELYFEPGGSSVLNLIKKSRDKIKINLWRLLMRYFIFKSGILYLYAGPAARCHCTTCQVGICVALWPALEVTNEKGDT